MTSLQANDFELFGLPQRFAQDRAQIDARWKELQRQTHPDKFTTQGAYFKLGYDSLDNINFPTQGRRLVFEYYQRSEDVINQSSDGITYFDRQYGSSEGTINWKGALNLGNHSFVTKAVLSRVDSDADDSVFITRLGGFLNLSGYH
ncbi:MAG: hypothetical protein ACO260_09275, partial [Hylemonella sp.]